MSTRSLISAAATLLALLVLSSSATAQEAVEWSYEGPTGPEHWASLSPAFAPCGEGSLQSPIDLRDPARRPAPRIVTDYVRSPVTELNNGETIEVRSERPQTLRVGGKPFELVQFHFHVPSEHLVVGDRSPLEIHFVHQAADGERAVLGTLVEGGRRNRAFGALRRSFPEQVGEETRVERAISLTRLLPASRRAYRYPGSLTTPPCTEGIRWMVLARPVTVSERQLDALEELVEGNARPIQPRNGRPLILH
jgi:carbonic anhydrase